MPIFDEPGFMGGAEEGSIWDPPVSFSNVAVRNLQNEFASGLYYGTKVFFKPDGLMFYVLFTDTGGTALTNSLRAYTCPTPFNIAAATQTHLKSLSGLAVTNTHAMGLHFSTDGTKIYIAHFINKIIYCYSLSVAWNITSTWTLLSQTVVLTTNPWGFHLSPDGSKLFVVYGQANIFEYDLSTPWDLSTIVGGTYTNAVGLGGSQGCYDFTLSDDGKQGIWCVNRYDSIGGLYSFSLPTPWSLAGIVLNNVTHVPSFVISNGIGLGFFMNADGSRFYGLAGDSILRQYNKT